MKVKWPGSEEFKKEKAHRVAYMVAHKVTCDDIQRTDGNEMILDADSSRAPGLTSGLQGSVNVHRGALLLVPQ